MRRTVYSDPEPIQVDRHLAGEQVAALEGLPNRLLTAFEVAEFVGCHEETVRRARSAVRASIAPGCARSTCTGTTSVTRAPVGA